MSNTSFSKIIDINPSFPNVTSASSGYDMPNVSSDSDSDGSFEDFEEGCRKLISNYFKFNFETLYNFD